MPKGGEAKESCQGRTLSTGWCSNHNENESIGGGVLASLLSREPCKTFVVLFGTSSSMMLSGYSKQDVSLMEDPASSEFVKVMWHFLGSNIPLLMNET
eukprot:CCRYP_017787-RA/>CCRYP_017787-RA protein AED:0.47 eAED:0.55 QI:0/0/0/1/0/0/2/0/97